MLTAFFSNFAPNLTAKTTAINTRKNEITGNQLPVTFAFSCNETATTADNFKAAAIPTKKATNEKTATINPRLKPLIMASTNKTTKMISIIIKQ